MLHRFALHHRSFVSLHRTQIWSEVGVSSNSLVRTQLNSLLGESLGSRLFL